MNFFFNVKTLIESPSRFKGSQQADIKAFQHLTGKESKLSNGCLSIPDTL